MSACFVVTKEFLADARRASTVVFHGVQSANDPECPSARIGSIVFIFRDKGNSCVEIGRVTYDNIPTFVNGWSSDRKVKAACGIDFYRSHSPNNATALFDHLLRVGDTLTLEWYPDALQTEGLKSVGFTGDALYVNVRRQGISKPGKRIRMELEHRTCPVESSARMVQG